MADRGWLGLAFPSAYGGARRRFLDLYPLYEEMGRFLVPSPHLDTVALAGDVILEAGTEAQEQQVLPAIAAGRCLVSVATLEPSGGFGPAGMAATADRRGDNLGRLGDEAPGGLGRCGRLLSRHGADRGRRA